MRVVCYFFHFLILVLHHIILDIRNNVDRGNPWLCLQGEGYADNETGNVLVN